MSDMIPVARKPLIMAGLLLGIGLGGFVDGILFHQILQTHAMLSAKFPKTTVANMEINMFWDGVFHAATWTATVAGLAMLWKAVKRPYAWMSGKALVGAMFVGWGLFNLIEGIIDHHLLHLHHVVEQKGVSPFDYLFLGSGVVFILGGFLAIRAERPKLLSP
jgi:uncharacterized membrane protein